MGWSIPDYLATQARLEKNRKPAPGALLAHPLRQSSSHQGWYQIGGRRLFFRSRWEVNYACYLELLRQAGQITAWDYEPEVFWFSNAKRAIRCGTTNYKPDFRVTWADGRVEYFEVKGWLDPRSKTKLKRMRIYHPEVKLTLIDKAWFAEHRALAKAVPGWNTLVKLPPAAKPV